jgi:type I restriction enzyme S subunit
MSEWQETDIGFIPHDWESVKFTEILETTLRNGLNKPSRVRGGNGDYKLVNMNEIFAHDVIKDISMEFVELDAKDKSTSLLKKYDLLFARQSLVLEGAGKCSIYMGNDEKVCFESHIIRARLNLRKSNPQFYYYFFSSHYGKRFIKTITEQAVVAGIRGSDLKELKIPYPPKLQQDAVVAVLSCLDRKIENLCKQNETLERIAQTLFKHWFVDFEFPNEDGKPYKSSGGEMKRSELGEIPAGWRLKKMEDVIEVRDGTHDSPKQTEEGFYLITSKHLKKEGIDFESAYLISESDYTEVNKRSKVDTYDILLSMIGTVGLLYFVLDQDINFAIKNIGLFKASKNLDYPEYIYLFLSSEYGKTYFRTRLAGTTQSYLTLSSLREMPLIIPDKAILLGFKQIAKSLFGKSHTNNRQIRTLTKTRDVLLPKLMSGKLRITE